MAPLQRTARNAVEAFAVTPTYSGEPRMDAKTMIAKTQPAVLSTVQAVQSPAGMNANQVPQVIKRFVPNYKQ